WTTASPSYGSAPVTGSTSRNDGTSSEAPVTVPVGQVQRHLTSRRMAMRRYFLTALVAGLLLCAAPAPGDDAKKDQEALQGTWKVVSVEDRGKADRPPDGFVLVFETDTFTLRDNKEAVVVGTFKLDPSKKPKAIDVTISRGGKNENIGKELRGIYEVDKDTLK